MRASLSRLWGAAPRPLRLASAVLAGTGAVDILLVLVELAMSGENVRTVAAGTFLLVLTGLLGVALAVLLLSGSRVAWLLSVVLLVAGLTAPPLDAPPLPLAFIASNALVLVLLVVPGTLRAVWQRPTHPRQRHDLAIQTER